MSAAQFDKYTAAESVADTLKDQIRGKRVIVTGVSPEGIGAEAARVIAKYAALVVLAGRKIASIEETMVAIRKDFPEANLRALVVDLGSFNSVRKAADEVNAYVEPINVLINNAGIMGGPYILSEEGFESMFATNHLGHFLFASLVFPSIVRASNLSTTSPSRVVNVSSAAHSYHETHFDDASFDVNYANGQGYDQWKAYTRSKVANVLFSNEIARRAKEKGMDVLAFSVNPGGIRSPLQKYVPQELMKQRGWLDEQGNAVPGKWKTVQTGAATYIVAAFDPSITQKSGAYLNDANVAEDLRSPWAGEQSNGEKLWELSEEFVGQKFEI